MSSVPNGWIVGEVKMLAHAQIEPGWLVCDGSAVSREQYSELFNKIGITWGAGNGTTTFNLPPVGITPVNWDPAQTEFQDIGKTGGTKAASMPAHGHTISGAPAGGPYVSSPGLVAATGAGAGMVVGNSSNSPTKGSLVADSVSAVGDNLQPYGVFMYVICYTNDLTAKKAA